LRGKAADCEEIGGALLDLRRGACIEYLSMWQNVSHSHHHHHTHMRAGDRACW